MDVKSCPERTLIVDWQGRSMYFRNEAGKLGQVKFRALRSRNDWFKYCCAIAIVQDCHTRGRTEGEWRGVEDGLASRILDRFGWQLEPRSRKQYWDYYFPRGKPDECPLTETWIVNDGGTKTRAPAKELFCLIDGYVLGQPKAESDGSNKFWSIEFPNSDEYLLFKEDVLRLLADCGSGEAVSDSLPQAIGVVDGFKASEEWYKLRANKIERHKNNLIANRDADASAIALGNLAIADGDDNALLALWEVICHAGDDDVREAISNPCAFTVGRITKERRDTALEDTVFQIFDASIASDVELIIDRFAYTVGEVARDAWKDVTKQRAMRFMMKNVSQPNPIVRDKYTYTKNNFLDWIDSHREDRRGEGLQSMGELFRQAEETAQHL